MRPRLQRQRPQPTPVPRTICISISVLNRTVTHSSFGRLPRPGRRVRFTYVFAVLERLSALRRPAPQSSNVERACVRVHYAPSFRILIALTGSWPGSLCPPVLVSTAACATRWRRGEPHATQTTMDRGGECAVSVLRLGAAGALTPLTPA